MKYLSLIVIFFSLYFSGYAQSAAFEKLCADFDKEYAALNIPETDLDYKVNFNNIGDTLSLNSQRLFFSRIQNKLQEFENTKLTAGENMQAKQLSYECELNLQRISLETKWIVDGRLVPENGLYSNTDWYSYYVKLFTSTAMRAEDVHQYGMNEVSRIQKEIDSVRVLLKFGSDREFYSFLKNDTFFLTDKSAILSAYSRIDKTVRKNISALFPVFEIPEIGVMEWPDAGPNTPPGMYVPGDNNPYGKDVFQYNFYGEKHNRRATEWLYLHEAIPGHHFQSIFKRAANNGTLQNRFFYFGNAEGWACYIEDLGEKMGLYQSPYTYLGKLEWDLVRSARLVMETGIHYYGWSREEAMNYWKKNIKGQDEIADREITRITNWPGQTLCYKVGALYIKKIVSRFSDIKEAHNYFLKHSDFPLEVL